MTINQGLLSLVNSSPNFSNQALENAINVLKNISGGFITKTFEVDTAIDDNTVLTTTQKNDVKATINARPYLNFGRYLNIWTPSVDEKKLDSTINIKNFTTKRLAFKPTRKALSTMFEYLNFEIIKYFDYADVSFKNMHSQPRKEGKKVFYLLKNNS